MWFTSYPRFKGVYCVRSADQGISADKESMKIKTISRQCAKAQSSAKKVNRLIFTFSWPLSALAFLREIDYFSTTSDVLKISKEARYLIN